MPLSRRPLSVDAEEFLSWLAVERGRAGNTLTGYRHDLAAYESWLCERGSSPSQAGEADVAAYLAHLRAGRLRPATVARALAAVRGLHRFCLDEGQASSDPSRDLGRPAVPQGLPRPLSEKEVGVLLGVVAGDDPAARRDRAMLELLYGAGLRISELVSVCLADLSLEEGLLRVLGKGSKERVVPVGRLAGQALERWLAPGGRPVWAEGAGGRRRVDAEALFLNARGGRLSRQGAWGVVRRHGARAGLGDRLTPHVLRHSCATHMLDHGADIRVVQELLGHASVATTQVYTRVSARRLHAVYRAAHPRARGRDRTPTDGG
jgi:integrase/recombinase XerD